MSCYITCVLLALLAPPSGSRASQGGLSADSVIAHYYAAIGGRDALLADSALAFSGHYEEGAFKAQTTILWKRPNLRRVSVIGADGFPYIEIFDGVNEWEASEAFSRPLQHDTGAAERALEGRNVEGLRVTLRDGWTKEYYFDSASGLLVALRKAMPVHAAGPDVVTLSFFRDYRRLPRAAAFRPGRAQRLDEQVDEYAAVGYDHSQRDNQSGSIPARW